MMKLEELAALSSAGIATPHTNQFTYSSWSEYLEYMPFRTPQWKKNTLTWWSIDTDKDGSGSSLVLVYLNPYEPDWIRQMFTVRIRVKEEDTNAIIDWLSEHMPPLWKLKN